MIVAVSVRSVDGQELVFPAGENARLLASLAGTETFSAAQVAVIRELGFTVFRQAEPGLPAGF